MTKQEIKQLILDNHKSMTCAEMAAKANTSMHRIYYHLVTLNLLGEVKKGRNDVQHRDPEKEKFVGFIIENHRNMTCAEMAKALGCSPGRIHHYLKYYHLVGETKKGCGGGYHVGGERTPRSEGYFDVDSIGHERTWLI